MHRVREQRHTEHLPVDGGTVPHGLRDVVQVEPVAILLDERRQVGQIICPLPDQRIGRVKDLELGRTGRQVKIDLILRRGTVEQLNVDLQIPRVAVSELVANLGSNRELPTDQVDGDALGRLGNGAFVGDMGHLRGSLDGGGRRGRCSRGSRSRGSRCGVLAVTTAGCGTEG